MISNRIVVVEHVKLLKRQLTWVVIGTAVGLSFAQMLAQYIIAITSPDLLGNAVSSLVWPAVIPGILASLTQMGLGQMITIVLFGAVIAQEYNWRTLHLWLARGIPRDQIIAAKVATFLPVSLAFAVLALLVVGAETAVFTVISTGALDFSPIDPLGLAIGVGATACSLLPYAAITLPLAVASRSTIAPIGGGIAFFFVEIMWVVLQLPGGEYTPTQLGLSLRSLLPGIVGEVQTSVGAAAQAGSLLDPTSALIAVMVWVFALAGLTYWILRRQDVTE